MNFFYSESVTLSLQAIGDYPILEELQLGMETSINVQEDVTPRSHQNSKCPLDVDRKPIAKRQLLQAHGQNSISSPLSNASSSPTVTKQVKNLRLPSPCPIPTNFTTDITSAIAEDKLRGVLKTRLLRQAAQFYWGLCPRPDHNEYIARASALCEKYLQLKDKKPIHGKYWVS